MYLSATTATTHLTASIGSTKTADGESNNILPCFSLIRINLFGMIFSLLFFD